MNRVAIVTVLVLVSVAAGAATAAGHVDAAAVESTPATADPGDANATSANNTTGASLGASISAFMQSNAERATQAVDQGMWAAAFNRSDRARKRLLAERHVDALKRQLASLADKRQALVAAYQRGEISRVAFQARMSALHERYRALAQSVDETRHAVGRANVDAPGLADIDEALQRGAAAVGRASNVSLPTNVTVPAFAGEQPTDVTTPFNASNATGSSNVGPPGNRSGPGSGNPGAPSANASTGTGPDVDAPSANTTTTTDTATTTDDTATTTDDTATTTDDTANATDGALDTTVTYRVDGANAEQTPF